MKRTKTKPKPKRKPHSEECWAIISDTYVPELFLSREDALRRMSSGDYEAGDDFRLVPVRVTEIMPKSKRRKKR